MIYHKAKYFFKTFSLLFFFASQLLAQDVIQPKVYHANNAVYALLVSPFSPDGIDGAGYTLQKKGEIIWRKELQFTAMMADVSVNGETTICAYTRGLEPPFDRNNRDDLGYMQLSLMDATGHLIWSQSIRRQHSMAFHQPPEPFCEQVMVHSQSAQAFFWYRQDQRTQLKTIDIKTGQPVNGKNLSLEQANELTSVNDIKFHDMGSSDLLLAEVKGWTYEDNEKDNGHYGYLSDALYYLLDTSGHVYWQQHMMGSLDIRKTTVGAQRQQAYSKRDAYLKSNDLIQVDAINSSFAITDYNSQQLHWFQLREQQVKSVNSTPLSLILTPFEIKVENQTSPKLLHSIAFPTSSNETKQPCSHYYSAIDVLSDDGLLLFTEDSYTVSKITGQNITPNFLTVTKEQIKDDTITQELMFVGQNDQIYVNLGQNHYAVFQSDGQYQSTKVLGDVCDRFCFDDHVIQKSSGSTWQQTKQQGVSLLTPGSQGYTKKTHTLKGADGRWFDYIYHMQSDQQGRLLLLGRIEDSFNQLYVLDVHGTPIITIDLGHGYTSAAAISNELIFISAADKDEVAVLNFSGDVVRRFKTSNGQAPYLMRANQDKLFAVTQDAVLVYDVATFNKN